MTTFSQRNWRWRWHRLGFTSATIGQFGCIITCLGNLLSDTPDQINIALKGGGGYANGNLVNWTRLHGCLPQLTFLQRVYAYDNQTALDAIASHGFILVEVDAAPIGNPGGKHWVIFVGGEHCIDPWWGAFRPTSDFPKLTGMCVLHKN